MGNYNQQYLFEDIGFSESEKSSASKTKKSLIDDGFNSEFVKNAIFTGFFEIPLIKNPPKLIVPSGMIPFSERKKSKDREEHICFYENDIKFREIFYEAKENVESLRKFKGIISPYFSLFFDMPLVLQITNTYLNRQIGHYLQEQGIYVIPNVRWGDERSYKRIIPTEMPFAFLGLEKHGIYSIGSYGCCKIPEYKNHLREGVRSFIREIKPEIILVYGAMQDSVFGEFKKEVKFVHYNDWITAQHIKEKVKNGNR